MDHLVENVPVLDTFMSGLGAVEALGGDCYRFTFYVLQKNGEAAPDKVVVAKLIAHASCIPDAIMRTIGAIGEKALNVVPLVTEMLH